MTDDLIKRRAIRQQLRKTLELYRDPTKASPKLSESIQTVFDTETKKLEEKQEALLAAQKKALEEERRKQAEKMLVESLRSRQTVRNKYVRLLPAEGRRKISFEE